MIGVKGLKKCYGPHCVFDGLDMIFDEGQIHCLLAPSGAGKTTLFNIMSGLEKADEGQIYGTAGKKVAYVFQEDRLIEWKTVEENIRFVVEDEADKEGRVEEMLRSVKLNGYENHYPKELSGGMRQRVSLARAFVYRPDILFMDEPFKGLDRILKEDIIQDFNRYFSDRSVTVIMTTHDISEAVAVADQIYVMTRRPMQVKMAVGTTGLAKDAVEALLLDNLEE